MSDEFSKNFPSLKGGYEPTITKGLSNKLAIAYPWTKEGEWYHKDTIQEHCLDKAKVKELLDTGKNPISTRTSNYLKKELGLED